jgi:enoyl-CoA hydratase
LSYTVIIVDDPAPYVRRITLNRPEKRNALNSALRGEILDCLRRNDQDPDVRVTIIRGGGTCFSSGYDLGAGMPKPTDSAGDGMEYNGNLPFFTAPGEGQWPRHVTEGWMGIWDLAKPVIAQVHGYCLAGGSELATGCDLVYVAEDAQMGYPAVRFDEQVLAIAARVAKIGPDLLQINKRAVHRGMDVMGIRTAIRGGTELCAIGSRTASAGNFLKAIREQGLNKALTTRDEKFGDYRTAGSPGSA